MTGQLAQTGFVKVIFVDENHPQRCSRSASRTVFQLALLRQVAGFADSGRIGCRRPVGLFRDGIFMLHDR